MRWDQAGSTAMPFARSVHDKYGATLDSPIDVFGIIRSAGIVLAFRPMSGKVSATLVRELGVAGIIVNSNHPLSRQRYSAAHELGHYEFGHRATVDCGEELDRSAGIDDQEKLAESFAAWFLMPYPLMLKTVHQIGLRAVSRPEDAYQIALRLGTSYGATVLQLRNQGLLDASAQQSFAKIAPAKLKRSIPGVEPPENLRNDIWHLDLRDNGREYFARPGDRIVLDVPEIPTSGRLWTNETSDGSALILHGEGYDLGEATLLEPSHADLVGGTVVKRFTFDLADEPSLPAATIQLCNKTPWRDDPFAEQFRLQVKIARQQTGFDPDLFAVAG